jgi:hypothetical protein
MDKSPEDLLRSMFGDEGPAEPSPPRNGTPLFQLSGALPEFAAETRRMLLRCHEAALADQVDELWIYDRCRCGMEDCATVYTAAETVPGPGQRGVGGGFEDTGYVLIDVADDRIVCIETLFYPEFVKALTELLPCRVWHSMPGRSDFRLLYAALKFRAALVPDRTRCGHPRERSDSNPRS